MNAHVDLFKKYKRATWEDIKENYPHLEECILNEKTDFKDVRIIYLTLKTFNGGFYEVYKEADSC